MSKKTEELVEALSGLTVLEMSELKTALEDKWGVKAAAPAAVMAAAPAGGGEAAAAGPTHFKINLESAPAEKKIGVIKVVREITGLGLKEAKDLVESLPKPIKDKSPKVEAEEIKKKLEDAGGKVTLAAA